SGAGRAATGVEWSDMWSDMAPAPTPPSGSVLISVSCPACGQEVVSPSLVPAEILDRHLRYCPWEPGDTLTA
ncbi:MAG: hypothetical protein ACYCZV_04770, partial [Acidimicrobiales bacterium]